MMWFLLILSNIFFTTTIAIDKTTEPILLKFDEATLTKLRLSSASATTSESYVDYELLSEYQCAIECIKDRSMCTGYIYDTANKICSLYHDASRTIDDDITKIVSFSIVDKII